MKKTLSLLLVATLLSGCATVDTAYPLCPALPAGALGCPIQPSHK